MDYDWTPTRFLLKRDEDLTGLSGEGVVASGVMWPDGWCTMRWKAGPAGHQTTTVYESAEALEALHGHEGRTNVLWLND